MKKVSVVMAFLNEKAEPLNTVISMNRSADPSTFEIIVMCDAPEYEFEHEITKYPNVRLVKNKNRLGPHAASTVGIHMAEAPSVLIIDAHMRFCQDDWVNKIHDACMTNPTTLFCTRSYVLQDAWDPELLDPMRDFREVTDRYSVGARLKFFDSKIHELRPLQPEWIEKSNFIKEFGGYVPCILGANYAANTEHIKKIRCFEGMKLYGFCEQFVSIKNWVFGWDCKGLDTVSIAHMFRPTPPFVSHSKYFIWNVLLTIHVLFYDNPRFIERCYEVLNKDISMPGALELLQENWDVIESQKAYFEPMRKLSSQEFLDKFNIIY